MPSFLMQGFDTNLSQTVRWQASGPDFDGSEYSSPSDLDKSTIEVLKAESFYYKAPTLTGVNTVSSLSNLPSSSGSEDLLRLDRGGGETAELKDDSNAGDWVLRGGTNDWMRIEDWSSGGLDQWTIQTNTWSNISVSGGSLTASHTIGDNEYLKIQLDALVPMNIEMKLGVDLGGSSAPAPTNEKIRVFNRLQSAGNASINSIVILTEFGGHQHKYSIQNDNGNRVNNGPGNSFSTSDVLDTVVHPAVFANGDAWAEGRLYNADGTLNSSYNKWEDGGDFASPVTATYWRPEILILNNRSDEAKDISIHYVDLRF